MKIYYMKIFLLSIFFSCIFAQINYRDPLKNSNICTKGLLQSPLNLKSWDSEFSKEINFLSDDYKTIVGRLALGSDGSSYSISAAAGTDFGIVYLSKQGVVTKNVLKKIVLNYPTEHLLEGVLGDVEVKLIHERVLDYTTDINENKNYFDMNTYFIISLLFKQGDNYASDNGFLDSLLNGWKNQVSSVPFTQTSDISFSMNDMGLIRARQFYFYEGSHTTFPCDENVNYLVINKYFRLDKSLFAFLDSQFQRRYVLGLASKEISQYNGRAVYRNFAITKKEGGASSGYLKCSLIFVFGLILSILIM